MAKVQPKFLNEQQNHIRESLEGLCLANQNVVRIKDSLVLKMRTVDTNKVSLICGGGSGHEPSHAGFVCQQMLTGAVCGQVFASPSAKEVYTAIVNCATPKGVLVIIKNYTGDIINFGLAAAMAQNQGIKVRTLIVEDDIALGNDIAQGKRGIAGTVLVYKVLGAAALSGLDLDQLFELGKSIISNLYSIGVSFGACSLPGNPFQYELENNQQEIGMGIHGEKGKKRCDFISCDDTIQQMVQEMTYQLNKSDRIIVLVNNLGKCTEIEMATIVRGILLECKNKFFVVERIISGRLMTSLDMHGFSISFLKIIDEQWLNYIDQKVDSFNWPGSSLPRNGLDYCSVETCDGSSFYPQDHLNFSQDYRENYSNQILRGIFEKLSNQKEYLNKLDAQVADGDLGESVFHGSQAVLKYVDNYPSQNQFKTTLKCIGQTLEQNMAGTSGPLYGVFILKISEQLCENFDELNKHQWCQGLEAGIESIKEIGRAKQGDRTMLDVLIPVLAEFKSLISEEYSNKVLVQKLLSVAQKASADAKNLKAVRGRSAYQLGNEVGYEEPGCELICLWLQYVLEGI